MKTYVTKVYQNVEIVILFLLCRKKKGIISGQKVLFAYYIKKTIFSPPFQIKTFKGSFSLPHKLPNQSTSNHVPQELYDCFDIITK